jgi:hypothetical protein
MASAIWREMSAIWQSINENIEMVAVASGMSGIGRNGISNQLISAA